MTEAVRPESGGHDDTLELRILSGAQAGAQAPVLHGQSIGTAMDCDFILAASSAPIETCELLLSGETWRVGRDAVPMPLNQPALFGSTWLTVAQAGQPWPQTPVPVSTPATENADMPSENESPSSDPQTDAALPEAAPTAGVHAKKPSPADRKNRAIYVGILIFLLLAMAASAALLLSRSATSSLVPDNTGAERELALQAAIQKINEALSSLGVSDRLSAVRQANGTILVSGWARTAEERDKVALAMTRIWPMPGLNVQIEDEIVQRIELALARQPIYYTARYMDNGKVRLEGVALDQTHLERAENMLRDQFPGITVDTASVMLADDTQALLQEKLRAAGYADASLAWQDKKLVVTSTAQNRAEYSAMQALVADFNETHGRIARLVSPGGLDSHDAPFEIRTIISGAQPYIVLSDGRKVLVGGNHDGYRLEAIEPTRIILQGRERIVIER